MQLHEEDAKLRVHAPTLEPAYIIDLKERMSAMESSHKELQASHNLLQELCRSWPCAAFWTCLAGSLQGVSCQRTSARHGTAGLQGASSPFQRVSARAQWRSRAWGA